MKFIDTLGNSLEEGQGVSFPLAFGQSLPGKIIKLEQGLGAGPASIPHVAVAVIFQLDVAPNGMVGGVFALPKPESGLVTG